jgi:hypothetical protein
MTRGPDPEDYRDDTGRGWTRALKPSVEFSCRIEPGHRPLRVVVGADDYGWPRDLRIYRSGASRPLQVLTPDPELTSPPSAGGAFVSAMDLDGD